MRINFSRSYIQSVRLENSVVYCRSLQLPFYDVFRPSFHTPRVLVVYKLATTFGSRGKVVASVNLLLAPA